MEVESASGADTTITEDATVTAPTTGDAAIYGTAVKNGIQLAVDEINAAGGINGKKKIAVIIVRNTLTVMIAVFLYCINS